MGKYGEWHDLIDHQTSATIEKFWKLYCETEVILYNHILDHPGENLTGVVEELIERFNVDSVMFYGFLDGIAPSLNNELTEEELYEIDDSSFIDLDIDLEKLYYNMLEANAKHLYSLKQWEVVLPKEKRRELAKQHHLAGTVIKGKKIGRNDPCPCGSGRKYKHCCGRS